MHGGSDAVHIGDTLFGESLAKNEVFVIFDLQLDASDQSDRLEFVQAVANVFTSSHARDLSLGASAVLGSVVPSEVLDAAASSLHVELVGNAGSTVVEPVISLRWQFLLTSSLNVGAPLLSIIN